MGERNDDFMTRRKNQLAQEGRGDLVHSLEREQATGLRVVDLPAEEKRDVRSVGDVLAWVRDTLSSLSAPSRFSESMIQRSIAGLTYEQCLDVLRRATPGKMAARPAYYSALYERARLEREHARLQFRTRLAEVTEFVQRYVRPGQYPSEIDTRRVYGLSRDEIIEIISHVSLEDVRIRMGFYLALLDRIAHEF